MRGVSFDQKEVDLTIDVFAPFEEIGPQDRLKLKVDFEAFARMVCERAAKEMGENLFVGEKTNGSGPSKIGKRTKRPRGSGTGFALSIHAEKDTAGKHGAEGEWVILAREVAQGQTKRVLRGAPFAPPNMGKILQESLSALLKQG